MKLTDKIKINFNNIIENIKIIIITFIITFLLSCILFLVLLQKYNLFASLIIKMFGK